MKILVLTTKSPFPLYEGRALRTYNLIKQISKNHEIYLFTFVQTPEEMSGVEHMRTFCAHVEAEPLYLGAGKWRILPDLVRELFGTSPLLAVKYRSRTMRKKIRAILATQDIDLVHLDMLHLGDYIDACRGKPVVLVEHNVESVLLRRRVENESNWLRKAYLYYQYLKLLRYEARICRQADHVVAVSEVDADLLRNLSGAKGITAISNGVDTAYFREIGSPRHVNGLVFVGGLNWFPNYDAIRYFCSEVLPRVAAEIPDVTLTVVGKSPDNKKIRDIIGNPRVRLTGLVDDVRPEISEADAYVVPLRIGGGTRLKILDALSMGKAIVSTSVGCEGLDVVHGRDLLVADDPEAFARETVGVLRDRELARRLGEAGRRLVQQKYEWGVIAKELDRVYEDCRARTRRAAVRPIAVGDGPTR
ncbi:glycosyltransferase family 4 protein [Sulfuricaulis sp.]|uniref:glycosyltransferase family 4 protein n=1 Tax=Sulfuricaulis sp. TaxID=2003553 RepID=UPI00355AA504